MHYLVLASADDGGSDGGVIAAVVISAVVLVVIVIIVAAFVYCICELYYMHVCNCVLHTCIQLYTKTYELKKEYGSIVARKQAIHRALTNIG